LEHKQERAWFMAPEQNASLESGLALPAKLFRQMGLPELAAVKAA